MGSLDESKWYHRHVTWILCLHLFFYATSAGVILSTTPLFFLERECNIRGLTGEVCNKNTEAQSVAADRVSQFSLAKTIPNFLSVSFVGFWSDKYGRKPLMVAATVADFVGKVIGSVAMLTLDGWQGWLPTLAGTAVSSFTGGIFGVLAVSFSAVVDATVNQPIAFRTIACGRAEGFMLFGLLLGPFGGAWACDIIGLDYCLAISAIFNVLDFFVLLLLPETVDWSGMKRPADTSCAKQCIQENPIVSLRLFGSNPISLRIGGVMSMSFTQVVGLATVLGLYLKHEFNWSGSEIGALQSFQYGANAVALVFLLPLLQRCLSIKQVILMSLLCMPATFAMYALIPDTYAVPMMFSVAALGVVNAVYFPGIRVVVVTVLGFDSLGRDQRGKAFGAIGVLETLMGAIGAQVAPLIYGATVGTLPSAVFFISAASMLPASLLLCGLPPFEDVVEESLAEQRQLTTNLLLPGVVEDSTDALQSPAFA